jgi:cytochrome c biogenesis protein CcmG, thiol:disulfide interchange protein DsbE
MNRKAIIWLPLALAFALFAAFFISLKNPTDHVIASQMVGKPLPEFVGVAAFPGQPGAATADYKDGKPRLLNIFASWCVPCVQEIPILVQMKAMGVEVDGLAVHDNAPALAKFLADNGNPYTRIGLDQDGRGQIAFGSAGVPETFVVDGQGKILEQHIGVVTAEDVPKLMAKMGLKP